MRSPGWRGFIAGCWPTRASVFDARATFIDAHTLDVGGKRVTAEKIVVATGGHPVRPPIPGADLGIISMTRST